MFLTTTVHPGLRAHPNTLFPSAFQSIRFTTKTITQMAQTITQIVTSTATITAVVRFSLSAIIHYAKSPQPTATDVIMVDTPGFFNAAANSSVFKTAAIDLIDRMLGHATAGGFFLQTAAMKIINAAPPVLPLSNGIKLAYFLTGFVLGAGVLQTAQYLRQRRQRRQRRHPALSATISAEERIARRWGFLWRKEVETGVALRGIVGDQAAQLLELDIQDALNAQSAHDVSDTTDESTPPQGMYIYIRTVKPALT